MFPKREIIIIANDARLSIGNIAKLLTSSGSLCNLVYLDAFSMEVDSADEGGINRRGYLGRIVDPIYHRIVVERQHQSDFDVVDFGSNGSGDDGSDNDGSGVGEALPSPPFSSFSFSSPSSSSSSSSSSFSMMSMLAALPHVHTRALTRLGDPP